MDKNVTFLSWSFKAECLGRACSPILWIGIWSSGQPIAMSTLLLVGRIFIHSLNYSFAHPLAHLFIIFMDQGLRAPQYWGTKTTMQTLPLLRGYVWVPCSLESLVCLHGRPLPPAPCMGKVGVCLSCVSGLWAPLGEDTWSHSPPYHHNPALSLAHRRHSINICEQMDRCVPLRKRPRLVHILMYFSVCMFGYWCACFCVYVSLFLCVHN